jgi:hypothetical protein
MCNSVRLIADASLVSISFSSEQTFADLHRLKDILNVHKGEDPVILNFPKGKKNHSILVGSQFWVTADQRLADNITSNFKDNVAVKIARVRV